MHKTLTIPVKMANTILKRFLGYMFSKKPVEPEVLMLHPCNQIHTFNMRFDINVLFLSETHIVMAVYKNVPPRRILPVVKGATFVVESAFDVFDGIEVGDQIDFANGI